MYKDKDLKNETEQKWRAKNKDKLIEYARKYREKHRDSYNKTRRKHYQENKEKYKIRGKQSTHRRKLRVFDALGGPQCSICGIDDFDVLTIDHTNCGGTKHRKSFKNYDGQAIYRWLIKNDFPEGFRVLCRNCNWKEHLRLNFGVTRC